MAGKRTYRPPELKKYQSRKCRPINKPSQENAQGSPRRKGIYETDNTDRRRSADVGCDLNC
jgi:hypothetical protein